MKLSAKVWLATAGIFVSTMPHAVGAVATVSQNVAVRVAHMKPCVPSLSYMKKSAKLYGRGKVIALYGSNYEWKALFTLWNRESRWDYTARNAHSSAFGIPQLLKLPHDTAMARQIDLGLKYIKHRYGKPSLALAFHKRNGLY